MAHRVSTPAPRRVSNDGSGASAVTRIVGPDPTTPEGTFGTPRRIAGLPAGMWGQAARKATGQGVVVAASIAVLLYLVVVPLIFLVWSSFRQGTLPFSEDARYTIENYLVVLGSPGTLELVFTTLVFTFGALAVGLGFACALAWLVERTDIPWRGAVFVVALAPIAIPGILVGLAWILLLGPTNGFVNHVLRVVTGADGPGPLNVYTIPGMIFLQGLVIVPTTFLLLSPAFRLMDPTLEEAAAVAGAGRLRTFRTIIVPLLFPAIGNALIFQFVTVVQAFDIPIVVGLRADLPVLSTRVYLASHPPQGIPDYGLVSTYSMLLLLISLVPLAWYARLTRRAAMFATVAGRAYRPRRVRLGWWKPVALMFVGAYALITLVLPTFIMLWMSVQPFYSQPSPESFSRITLKAFSDLSKSQEFITALTNTVIVAVAAATATTLLSMVVGWAIARGKGRWAIALDFLSFAPHVVPGVVIAVSALLLYLTLQARAGISIHGTIWVLVIGITSVTLGFGIRAFRASVLQLSLELEESAQIAGASWLRVMRRIVLPILKPSVVNIWLWTFLSALTFLTMALMLYSGRNAVLATAIYFRWETGQTASAAAMGVMLMAMSISFTVLVYRFIRRDL